MARPSRHVDQALLAAGRELFPHTGCAGLTLRAVAERAGVRVGMFHYHFASKEAFLRTLLQQLYEQMFATLAPPPQPPAQPLDALRHTLFALAVFAREHRATIGRVWIDAMQREPVALAFLRDNAPRHLGLLQRQIAAAVAAGLLRELPPLQLLMLVLGAVPLPLIFVAGLVDAGAAPLPPQRFHDEALADAAIAQRIELVLRALAAQPAGADR